MEVLADDIPYFEIEGICHIQKTNEFTDIYTVILLLIYIPGIDLPTASPLLELIRFLALVNLSLD